MSLFSEAHHAFRRRVRQFVAEHLAPHTDEWERRQIFPLEIFRELGAEGFLGMTHPQAYGGSGHDFGYAIVMAEEWPRSRSAGLALSIVAQTHFFSPLLAALGTEEQKQRFLVPAIRGELIGALASTEPAGGTDIANAIACRAEDEGDHWVITGEKKYITNGPIADFVVTIVRSKPEIGPNSLSLVIVPTQTPGFRVREKLRTLGLHTSPTGWLEFDHCRVPKSLTLGKPHIGFYYAGKMFLEERLIGCAGAVAMAQLVLEETMDYLRHRQAFGKPLSHMQTIRHRIVEMAAEVEMGRRFIHSVSANYAGGTVEAKEICMAKFTIPEMVQRIVGQCLQFHGGYGFLEENWLSRAYRDMRFLSVGGGATESMKDLAASYLRL
jgi:citronellyl-CoA dehydrogenase